VITLSSLVATVCRELRGLRPRTYGFHEDGHVLFTIEINRHEILFFDCPIERA